MDVKPNNNNQNVFLVCTGLGNVNRGYESFARESFEALKTSTQFELYLLKGGGKRSNKELIVPNLPRNNKLAVVLGRLIGKDGYFIEQLTFCFCLLPMLFRKRPSLIYYSDFNLGTFLWQLRRILRFKYRLLFSNGAPNGPPFTRMDHIQQLLPLYIEQACAGGTPHHMQTLLPYAINIDRQVNLNILSQRKSLKKEFVLPEDKKIIISVGNINAFHKRMDYVVSEFAALKVQDYFLLILGQVDNETSVIESKAKELLHPESYRFLQVTKEQVPLYMAVSDYFILASLHEGQPRVILEALSMGLLPMVHDYNVTRETLGKYAVYSHFTKPGMLVSAIKETDERNISKQELIEYAWRYFSWERLVPQYEEMIKKNLQ